jgi:hypothetical protein
MKVVYIGGYSRSGSTMLLRVLGEATTTVAIGELIYIWGRGYLEDQLCGCGEPFTRCDFWNAVSQAVFDVPSDKVPAARLATLQRRVHGYGAFPALWLPPLRSASYRRDLHEYGDVVRRLYEAVSTVSGARIVLDSSKVPQFARMLSELPDLDFHVVHLVRDSRGTAYSWQRQKIRTEIHWTTQPMDRHSLLRSSIEWDAFNFLFGIDGSRPKSYTLIRYEDLVGDPGAMLVSVAEAIGEEQMASELRSTSDEVGLKVSHTVAGNPSRFSSGKTRIAADEEWRSAMGRGQQLLVTAATAPLLRHYGYPLRARAGTDR